MTRLEHIQTVTDLATGEIITETSYVRTVKVLPPEPDYIKLYVAEIGRLYGIQSGHRDILLYVASFVDYQGTVQMNSRRKGEIAAMLKISPRSIDNALTSFCKTDIMKRLGRGDFELNPSIFGKGDWKSIRERRQSFVSKIRFSEDGIKVESIEPVPGTGTPDPADTED